MGRSDFIIPLDIVALPMHPLYTQSDMTCVRVVEKGDLGVLEKAVQTGELFNPLCMPSFIEILLISRDGRMMSFDMFKRPM